MTIDMLRQVNEAVCTPGNFVEYVIWLDCAIQLMAVQQLITKAAA